MKSIFYILSLFFYILSLFAVTQGSAQVISQFTWDSDPVTAASIGPDAVSVSSSAYSSATGVGGTNGINPGLPKQDITLILADDPMFDVDGIDFSVDYQRDESQASFMRRGPGFEIGAGSNFSVRYRVDNGMGGYNTISSGNIYAIPNDDVFRNYRFVYLPATGEGILTVDGVIMWSNDGPDNRNMDWTGAGDITIGVMMDGSGSNKVAMDNLTIGSVFDSPLPVELLDFEASLNKSQSVDLTWSTATEINNDYFTIEKSQDGQEWQWVAEVPGAGNSNEIIHYHTIDKTPFNGISYYRLVQTDFNGSQTHSKVEVIEINLTEADIHIYPNPSNGVFQINGNIPLGTVTVFNDLGQDITSSVIQDGYDMQIQIDLTHLPNGLYFVKTMDKAIRVVKE